MARYTGPKSRIARKFGEGIFGADKVLSKKNYPPGQHGNSRKRKTSEYGVQLREKQKAKYTYGVLEKQFRNLFEKAATAKGITGEVLLQLLEGRLDNVVSFGYCSDSCRCPSVGESQAHYCRWRSGKHSFICSKTGSGYWRS